MKEKIKIERENYEALQTLTGDTSSLVVQNVEKTRIRRINESKYVNVPSREIKKWFESRRT